jgi:hypothetical protein
MLMISPVAIVGFVANVQVGLAGYTISSNNKAKK